MCNLADDIEERGYKIGIERCIRPFILNNLKEGNTKEIIFEKLTKLCGLSPDEAEQYYNKYKHQYATGKIPQNV